MTIIDPTAAPAVEVPPEHLDHAASWIMGDRDGFYSLTSDIGEPSYAAAVEAYRAGRAHGEDRARRLLDGDDSAAGGALTAEDMDAIRQAAAERLGIAGCLSVVERRVREMADAIALANPPGLVGGLTAIEWHHDRVRRAVEKLRRAFDAQEALDA